MSSWLAFLAVWLFVAVPRPECVVVENADPFAGLPPHPATRNVDITVSFRGKPASGASLLLSTGGGQFQRQVTADSQGVAHLRDLQTGKCLVFATDKLYGSKVLLIVAADAKTATTGLSVELFTRTVQDFAAISATPVTEHLPRFAGVVKDLSGAPVAGAAVEIYPDGIAETGQVVTVRADNSGHFSADLPSGVYRALIRQQGFKAYRVGFQIEEKAASKDLFPVLQISTGCSPIW